MNCPNCGACSFTGPTCDFCGSKQHYADRAQGDAFNEDVATVAQAYLHGFIGDEQAQIIMILLRNGTE